jgi:hypothetical protein
MLVTSISARKWRTHCSDGHDSKIADTNFRQCASEERVDARDGKPEDVSVDDRGVCRPEIW